jgi:hypothetical protein
MKKYLLCSLALLVLIGVPYADAALLGIDLGGAFPDITIDGGGSITFTSAGGGGGGSLSFIADDLKITYSNALNDNDPLAGDVDFIMNWTVDNTGKLTGGTMIERVKAGRTATIKGKNYAANTVLLTGTVKRFGWANSSTPSRAFYDFLIEPVSGALVTDNVWPSHVPTGIAGFSDDGTTLWPGGNWWNGGDFVLKKTKADKAPIPEPGTLILLGVGLAGLAGYGWRRKKK